MQDAPVNIYGRIAAPSTALRLIFGFLGLPAQWLRYRRERHQLLALDARQRRDMGITADAIHRRYASFRRWKHHAGA